MRIALVESTPRASVYPLPLLKIGAWRKDRGDTVALFRDRLPAPGAYDQIWITTTFTYDIPHALGMVREAKARAGRVWVGGVAASLLPRYFEAESVDVHVGLLEEAEAYHPDYSLLGEPPAYSITHTSRGCVRRCAFCMVHRLEPDFVDRPEWPADLHPEASRVLFYDNNWFAKPADRWQADVAQLHGLVDAGRIAAMDFNQGLDARLLTEAMADALAGLPIKPVRFAFDHMAEDGHYQRAVRMMATRGFHDFVTYVLYNYQDTPRDFYHRLRASAELSQELRIACDSYPMRYAPILEADTGRKYVGEHWTYRQRQAVGVILGEKGAGRAQGILCHHAHNTMPPIEEFAYWLGHDADEFVALLSYPRLRQLCARKKGALRLARARREGEEAQA